MKIIPQKCKQKNQIKQNQLTIIPKQRKRNQTQKRIKKHKFRVHQSGQMNNNNQTKLNTKENKNLNQINTSDFYKEQGSYNIGNTITSNQIEIQSE